MRAFVFILVLSLLMMSSFRAAGPPALPIATNIADAHDLVILHPTRPYRIRFHLRVADQPYPSRWNNQVMHLFRHLDGNGDATLDKRDAARAPSLEQWQQLSSGAQVDPDGCPSFAALANGKKAVVPGDFRAYYAASTAGPLQVRWGSRPFTRELLSDTLFQLLDTNRDGKLSLAELQAAPVVLNRLDINEDEVIEPGEIMGRPYGDPEPMFLEGKRHGQALGDLPFFSLSPDGSSSALARVLLSRYDRNRNRHLERSEINLPARTFARLDRNGDGRLDLAELAKWADEVPDLEVSVPLTDAAATIHLTPGTKGTLKTRLSTEGLLVFIGDWSLELRRDVVPMRKQQSMPTRELFRFLDKNKDGYLDNAEVYQPPFTYVAWLRLADSDGDGRISEKEFLAFAQMQHKVQGSLTWLRLEDMGRSLFRLLDSNCDGQLGQRELRDAWKRLKQFDQGNTNAFQRNKLPQHYRLTLRYGPDPDARKEESFGPRPRPRPSHGPVWFRKMDRNGDGDVWRSEWLGTEEQFRRIDRDGDGLISLAEAEQYDKEVRGKGVK